MGPEKQSRPKVTYLAPTGRANTDRGDGKESRVNLAELGEECEEGGPYTDEEGSNVKSDSPHSTSICVTPVRRGTIAQACDRKAYYRSLEPSLASDGSSLRLKSAKQDLKLVPG